MKSVDSFHTDLKVYITSKFEARLVYNVSSRTARATQRNSISKNKQKYALPQKKTKEFDEDGENQ